MGLEPNKGQSRGKGVLKTFRAERQGPKFGSDVVKRIINDEG